MKSVAVLLACLFSLSVVAQDGAPAVPTDFTLETPADYQAQAALARKCMAWLTGHSLSENPETREALNAFALLWLSGHPELRVDVNSAAMPCLQEHEDLFTVFICGVALYQMKHPNTTDQVVLHAEGLRAVYKATSATREMRRCRCLKPLRKAARKEDFKPLAQAALNGARP